MPRSALMAAARAGRLVASSSSLACGAQVRRPALPAAARGIPEASLARRRGLRLHLRPDALGLEPVLSPAPLPPQLQEQR